MVSKKNKKVVAKSKRATRVRAEIKSYDQLDTTTLINRNAPLKFEDLGLKLPKHQPTQVISIRLPSQLLNEIKALGSEKDIPYEALIKMFLLESVAKSKKKSA